jgi:DNA-directed RNA polymerase subunit RPC12/RpoP
MPTSSPKCAKCGTRTEEGFIVDNTYGSRLQSSWVEGPPDRSRWTGVKVRGRVVLPITSYRCPKCGYLESYATSDGEAG